MPSRILPSLLSSFVASLSSSPQPSSSSAATLAPALALYPSTITFAAPLPGEPELAWRGQLVPLFNLVLGLVVFLFLVEERCGEEVLNWVDDLTRGRYSLSSLVSSSSPSVAAPTVASAFDLKRSGLASIPEENSLEEGAEEGEPKGMGLKERSALVGALVGVMGSMLFWSNEVFDLYALRLPSLPSSDSTTRLLEVATRFSSFSILVLFLLLSLLLLLLAPQPRTTLPPVVFLWSTVLFSSTVVSRVSLAVHTIGRGRMGSAHWALLVGEPVVLLFIQGWMLSPFGGQRRSGAQGDVERVDLVGRRSLYPPAAGRRRAGTRGEKDLPKVVVTSHT